MRIPLFDMRNNNAKGGEKMLGILTSDEIALIEKIPSIQMHDSGTKQPLFFYLDVDFIDPNHDESDTSAQHYVLCKLPEAISDKLEYRGFDSEIGEHGAFVFEECNPEMRRYKKFGIVSVKTDGTATLSGNAITGIFKLFDKVVLPMYKSVYRGFIAVDNGEIVAAQDLTILEGENNEFDSVRVLRHQSETIDDFICSVGFFLQGRDSFLGGGKNFGRINESQFTKITQ